jgi:hypothetical protein
MVKYIVCSKCFKDQGLKLFAYHIGKVSLKDCPNCKASDGKKLDKRLLDFLVSEFFERGSTQRFTYGAAPSIMLVKQTGCHLAASKLLKKDMELIRRVLQVGFVHSAPKAWRYGENECLRSLRKDTERHTIIQRIINEYPSCSLPKGGRFYRLRPTRPLSPSNPYEYDSRPRTIQRYGRLDSKDLSVMYASHNIQVCIHECRATAESDSYLATLAPKRNLKLLNLTELLNEEDVTEFESLDIAVHMLFLAAKHSYNISRSIAIHAHKVGYDGLLYPSFYSLALSGARPLETIGYGNSIRRFPELTGYAKSHIFPNIALFGRPIEEGLINVECINRLIIKKALYDIQFGPVI